NAEDGASRGHRNERDEPLIRPRRLANEYFRGTVRLITIMKTGRITSLTVLGLLPMLAFAATPSETPRVEVNFFEPEKFTDVKDSYMGDHERTTYLDSLRDHLVERAPRHV